MQILSKQKSSRLAIYISMLPRWKTDKSPTDMLEFLLLPLSLLFFSGILFSKNEDCSDIYNTYPAFTFAFLKSLCTLTYFTHGCRGPSFSGDLYERLRQWITAVRYFDHYPPRHFHTHVCNNNVCVTYIFVVCNRKVACNCHQMIEWALVKVFSRSFA